MSRWRVNYLGKELQHLGTVEAPDQKAAIDDAASSPSLRRGSAWGRPTKRVTDSEIDPGTLLVENQYQIRYIPGSKKANLL
jgi:hypothetical protein